MNIQVIAYKKTTNTVISRLYIDNHFECFILEDKDRGLKQSMTLTEILAIKQPGTTAIPEGKYSVDITYSNRFGKDMPLVVNVPGYEGIRIHPGNYAVNTEGCLLPGTGEVPDMVTNSVIAFHALVQKLIPSLKTGNVTLEIIRNISIAN